MSQNQRIALHLSGGDGCSYSAWPVTQGIPFADGVLQRGIPVRVVDENGHPLPTQAKCQATWNKDLKYIKWLLVDFQADLRTGQKRQYFLEYGPDANAPMPKMPVKIEESEGHVQVNTGPLRILLGRTQNVFLSCGIRTNDGWREIFCDNPAPHLYMKDQHGNCYTSLHSGFLPQITVEESGPVRTCVCIKGYHAMPAGQRFCPYILRLHFFAGKSDIRVFHTFIFDQEPHQIELKAIGMKLPLNLGRGLKAAVAGESTAHGTNNDEDPVAVLQRNDKEYEIKAGTKRAGGGEKNPGWAKLQGSDASVVAVVKDFWQEYPKGLLVAKDTLDIQIWPETYGETLKFTTPFEKPEVRFNGTRDEEEVKRLLEANPEAPMNLKSFSIRTKKDLLWVEEIAEKYGRGRAISHNDISTDNGIGAAKTTEIFLRFSHEPITDTEAHALCAAVQEPLIAPANPVHSCATKAVGHAYHAGDARFSEIDAGLDDILELTAIEPMEKCRLYGMMRYGNMVCSHAPGPGVSYIYYKDREPEKALRYVGPYNNEANDQIGAVWGNFIRTGKREHYFLAQRYSRNVADVGFIHAHPANFNAVGLMHYHNAHQWSGYPSPSHTLVRGLLLDYYFTGNVRLLEVARETAEWCVRTKEPCGIISCRNGTLHREFTGPLWSLLEVYQATWEEKYGDLARRSLNWFLRTLPEPGTYPVSVYTRGDRGDEAVVEPPNKGATHAREIYYLLEAALRLFPSKTLQEHIIAEANQYVWNEPTDKYVTASTARKRLQPGALFWQVDDEFYWTTQWGCAPLWEASVVCLAYDLTGDPVYAVYAGEYIEKTFLGLARRCRRLCEFSFTLIYLGSFIPRLAQIVADALDKDPEGFAKADGDWRRKRRESGMPVYEGSGINLDKDIMDINGDIVNRAPVTLLCEGPARKYEPRISLGRISAEDHAIE
ncbi:MAG: hypothetical protein Q7J98_03635 [Kiritimatiellia bacterium]|nr:hypothetical protein [Kiritimatiellia bacterium]